MVSTGYIAIAFTGSSYVAVGMACLVKLIPSGLVYASVVADPFFNSIFDIGYFAAAGLLITGATKDATQPNMDYASHKHRCQQSGVKIGRAHV